MDVETTQGKDPTSLVQETKPDDRKSMMPLSRKMSHIVEDQLDDMSSSSDSESSIKDGAARQKPDHPKELHDSEDPNVQKPAQSGEESPPSLPCQPRIQKLPPKKAKKVSRSSPHNHLARFQSLRSILFSAHMQDKEAKCRAQHGEAQHSKSNPTKGSVLQRAESKVQRLMRTPSKDITTISESTSSSSKDDDDDLLPPVEDYFAPRTKTKAPPLEAEPLVPVSPPDTESDSDDLKPSDVPELVRHASRLDGQELPKGKKQKKGASDTNQSKEHSRPADNKSASSGLSDASTESDNDDFGQEDMDDLIKWVSRKPGDPEGAGGPVKPTT